MKLKSDYTTWSKDRDEMGERKKGDFVLLPSIVHYNIKKGILKIDTFFSLPYFTILDQSRATTWL
jgi:hypothetical protein